MSRPRILRLLRIAFSAVCGIVCLLLIVLCMRSHSWEEGFAFRLRTQLIAVNSTPGGITLLAIGGPSGRFQARWSRPIDESWEFGISESNGTPMPSILGFRWRRAFNAWLLTVPYWLLILLTAALAVIAWIKLMMRFSLRTLLIATTLVAVALGIVVYAIR